MDFASGGIQRGKGALVSRYQDQGDACVGKAQVVEIDLNRLCAAAET
ncbi:MAG: hypothetical protein ABJD24_01990 [Acidimicrobiales bacterium]